MLFKTKKLFFILPLKIFLCLAVFFECLNTFSQSVSPINFTKKQILFLKWGKSNNELGLVKNVFVQSNKKTERFIYPTAFGVDGMENIYILDQVNKRVLIFDKAGRFSRSVPCAKPAVNGMLVDLNGDIYFPDVSNNFKNYYVIKVSKSNKRIVYDSRFGKCVYNEVMFDNDGNSLLKSGDASKELKADQGYYLFGKKNYNLDKAKKRINIKVSSDNNFLKSLNVSLSDLKIPFIEKDGLITYQDVLGLNNQQNIFVWYGFYKKRYGLVEEDVYIYSFSGVLVDIISINVNELDSDIQKPLFVKLAPDGHIYHMWVSEDGVHVYKW